MNRFLLLFLLSCWCLSGLHAQFIGQDAPPNDVCAKAIQLDVGDLLTGHTNAEATPSLEFERPAVFETTCIQTIENDVWYKFKAAPDVSQYEVEIVAGFCATPAGLQALLIKAEGCNASNFVYRGCSNKINTDTIKLYLLDPEPGKNYFVWVDGYDGTMCEFDIQLKAVKPLAPTDYRFLRFDYDVEERPFETEIEDLNLTFSNNAATISWSAEPNEMPDLYIIELLPILRTVGWESKYARVVGYMDPHRFVGSGRGEYAFTDFVTPYLQGETYRYRVVSVFADGKRETSQVLWAKAVMVESFDVREVKSSPEPGKFIVHYINRKKGQRYDVMVENASREQVKHMVLDKEPVRDGDITIDMSALPHGEYFFLMSNGKDSFRRSFVW